MASTKYVSDATTDNDLEVEIDLGEIDWTTPAAWEDSPLPASPASDTVTSIAEDAAPLKPKPSSKPEAPPKSKTIATLKSKTIATPKPKTIATPKPEAFTRSVPLLPPAFDAVVGRVEPEALRELVGSTFARLLRALDTLGVIEKALTRPKVVGVGMLFDGVRAQTAALLSRITEAVSGSDSLDGHTGEMLDGMRFVIGHELTKVFRQEFPGLADGRGGPEYSRADLSRAWGLLHNCLQQTAITLAQMFDPGATGERLFEDYRSKVENSFTLYRELKGLHRKVVSAERSNGILLKHSLVRHLEHFRDETMHFLMYKDWGEFGRYVDGVRRAFEEMEEFESVLHEFSQYLSTLIHHVSMREVLRVVPQPPTKASDSTTSLTQADMNAAQPTGEGRRRES